MVAIVDNNSSISCYLKFASLFYFEERLGNVILQIQQLSTLLTFSDPTDAKKRVIMHGIHKRIPQNRKGTCMNNELLPTSPTCTKHNRYTWTQETMLLKLVI